MIESLEQLRGEIQILRGNNIDTDELVRIADAIEREVEERYVELPKDADGDVWRVGDLVVAKVNPNNPKRIERMLWYGPDSGWQLETGTIIFPFPERARHYHAPTVEDVLEDYRVKYYDLVTDMECENITNEEYVQGIKELASEFAAKLQLREAE